MAVGETRGSAHVRGPAPTESAAAQRADPHGSCAAAVVPKRLAGGKLPTYSAPAHKFTPGTNGVGVIEAVGGEVWQLKVGQRVVFSPYLVAAENVDEPEQILIGLTSMGPSSAPLQADWPDGTLAQFALAPVSTVTPVKGLERMSAAQLAVLNRAIVPFGGLVRRWS